MAMRLEDFLIEGWLYNTTEKSTHGALLLEGMECPVSIQLTGDAGESLHGRGFSFKRGEGEPPPVPIKDAITPMQIGVTGTMELRMAKVPVGDYLQAIKEGRKIDFTWLPCLYIEWYGPNGRMVLELANPHLVLDQGPPFDDPVYPDEEPGNATLEITEFRQDDDGKVDLRTIEPKPDFMEEDGAEEGLDVYLERLNDEREAEMQGRESLSDIEAELAWGERAMFSEEGDFLASLLEPEKLPAVEDVDEEQAKKIVYSILTQLALYHVAVHLCHHCTWRQAYEFILDEVLFESRVPREIVHTGWAMNYSYGESCPECEKEILRKMKEREEE